MSEPAPQSTRAAILIPFAIVTLIWGSTWLVIRDQVSSVPPSWSVTYRFLVAGLAMLVLALIKRDRFALDARGWAFAAAIGLSQFVLNFNFVYRAEEHITSGIVAVVFALLLVPNAVFSRIFLGQRMGRQLLVGSAVAMAGIALLFLHEARLSPNGPGETMLGIGLTLSAILCASSANILQATKTAKRYPMFQTLAAAMLIGTAIDAVAAYTLSGPPVIEWRTGYIGGILYLGLLGSALTGVGRLEEAVRSYSKAVAIRPKFAEGQNNLGYALQVLGRLEEAIMHYKKAIAARPKISRVTTLRIVQVLYPLAKYFSSQWMS